MERSILGIDFFTLLTKFLLSTFWRKYREGFPGDPVVKNPPVNAGVAGSILGSGRSPGEGNGNPCKYSCLENPMHRRTWWAIVHGVSKSRTRQHMHFYFYYSTKSYKWPTSSTEKNFFKRKETKLER